MYTRETHYTTTTAVAAVAVAVAVATKTMMVTFSTTNTVRTPFDAVEQSKQLRYHPLLGLSRGLVSLWGDGVDLVYEDNGR